MKKSLRVLAMTVKYYLYGFVFQLFFFNPMYASPTDGQRSVDINEVHLSFDLQDATTSESFTTMTGEIPFGFYDQGLVEKLHPVDLQVESRSLEQVHNRISVKEFGGNEQGKAVVLDVHISGRVVDAQGQPIPGVTVSVSGASIGTTTDL